MKFFIRDLPIFTFLVGIMTCAASEWMLRRFSFYPTIGLLCIQGLVPELVRLYPNWFDKKQKMYGGFGILISYIVYPAYGSRLLFGTFYADKFLEVVSRGYIPATSAEDFLKTIAQVALALLPVVVIGYSRNDGRSESVLTKEKTH
jgi:hypothetical protein